MSKRSFVLALSSVALSIFGTLLAAEGVLRLLPVNEGLRAQDVTAEQPVFRFAPERTATWSEGWNFEIVNRVHVNNDGFVNDRDYDPEATSPLLAIVGDSYIEAGIVPYSETVQGRLAALLGSSGGPRGRAYSFGASGAGLSQYLVWLAHARDRYRPQMAAVSIISNDFSESLLHRGQSPGFHHFERLADGAAALRRMDYRPSLARRALRRSALAMYLITNVKIQQILDVSVQNLGKDDRRWSSNVPYASTEAELADYRWAVDVFLDRLPEAAGLPPGRILLTLDGLRPDLYDPLLLPEAEKGTWALMRAYVAERAVARGFVVLDLEPIFLARHAKDGRRFESDTDNHWNGYGHGVVATAISNTPLFQKVFSDPA